MMTQRDFITMALANPVLAENDEFVEKGQTMLSALDKKKGSSKGKTDKGTKINKIVKDTIIEILGSADTPLSIPAIIPLLPDVVTYKEEDVAQTYSSQRVSGLLTQLRKENIVKRVMDKKTATFTLGSESEGEGAE